jgi:predicted transcriptional regulator
LTDKHKTLELTAHIVAAYLDTNQLSAAEIPALIQSVDRALNTLNQAPGEDAPAADRLTPAKIRKSITADALISFIDGKPYKLLKRHLSANGLTPQAYREQFGLPADYPMTAPNYAEARSRLAKAAGLGSKRPPAKAKATRVRKSKP